MGKRKQPIEPTFKCSQCGDVQAGKKDGKWTKYFSKCGKCGGKVDMIFPEEMPDSR